MKLKNNENLWKSSVNYRDNWKSSFSDKLDFPRIIQFETHSYCNAACVMCPYKDVHDLVKNGRMDMVMIERIADECEQYDKYAEYEILPFMMNEPSLDPRLPKIVALYKKKLPNAAVSIYTNGILVNDRFWEELVESEPDSIVFSIHHLSHDEYARITGGSNLDDCIRNMDYVKEQIRLKNKHIELVAHMVRMDMNINEMLDTMKFWERKGIKCRSVQLENRAGSIDNKKIPQNIRYRTSHRCMQILSYVHIFFDGRVALCSGDWWRECILGDLNQNRIQEIWNSSFFSSIRNSFRLGTEDAIPEICGRCNMRGDK